MCGIFGEYSFRSKLTRKDKFIELLGLSRSRGPDKQGYFTNSKNLQLGFNRLSILDLTDRANQPIHSQNNKFTMVFNGEVYNYLEIKNRLNKYDLRIKSSGDSEVLVNAFSLLGIKETLRIIDGMYAIGLFEHSSKSLYLIRDFAGIKPIHYGYDDKGVVFASQYNQIALHPNFKDLEINREILKLYILQHFVPPPFGILHNTFQVYPGEIVKFDSKGKKNSRRYWNFPEHDNFPISNHNEAIEFIDITLKKAVKDELVSDVPLGSFLSGGIDSPLISYYAQKSSNRIIDTITIGSDSHKHDESELALTYSNLIGTKHLGKKMCSNDLMDIVFEMTKIMTEPFADHSIIPMYLASRLAKKNITVALSGDGGDELFYGYERFWSISKNIRYQKFPQAIKYCLYLSDKFFFNNRNINGACLYPTQGKAHFNIHSRFNTYLMNSIFPYLKNIKLPYNYNIYDYPPVNNELQLLQHMRKAEFYGMMQKTLRKVDKASMANSLEVRSPFLKKTVIEAALKINPYLNYGPNRGKKSNKKVLLKQLLKSKLPNSPIDNQKRGFTIPLSNWLRGDLAKPFREILNNKECLDYFDVNKNIVDNLFLEHLEQKANHQWPIFTIFSLFSWRLNLLK